MSPFIKITSKYCPNCSQDTLSVLTNGHKNKPEFVEYVCKNCNHYFKPTYKNYILAPHTLTKRRLKCPNCGKTGYFKKKLSKSQ